MASRAYNPGGHQLKDVVFEQGDYFVVRVPYGFDVYKQGVTHAVRVARVGYQGDKGLERAKLEIEKREMQNPAASPEQYRLAQAVLSGTARGGNMPVSVAREIVDRTPAGLRSEYSRYTVNPGGVEVELTKHHHFLPFSTKKAAETMKRLLVAEGVKAEVKKVGGEWGVDHTHANPFYGTDLDFESSMSPAWMYYGSKAARDAAARLYEGEGKRVVKEHSFLGYKPSGKKWRLRLADHRGNPSKAFGGSIHQQLVHAATEYDMKEQAKAAKRKHGYHNIYALSQYLGRIEEVEKDIAAGTPVRKAITDGFTGRLLDAMLKAVGETRSTREEQRGGAWSYSPSHGNPKKRPSDVDGNPVPQNYEMLSIRRNQGDALDVKKGLALENIPSVIVEPPSTTFGESTGNWSVWTPRKTYKRAVRLAEKAYFDRYPEKMRNPQESADGMYESFHGEPSAETLEIEEDEHYHSHLASLGELVEIKVKLHTGENAGGKVVIGFEDSGVEESGNPKQKWLLPFRRGKKNYEDVGYLPYALEHDIGFGGDKMYRPVKYENGQITVMSSELAGSHYDRYSRKSSLDAVKHLAQNAGMKVNTSGSQQNPFWPFNSFTKTTIYHVGTGEKYTKKGSYKGYTLYQKTDSGEFLVPALDKDSRFDTMKDAKEFVNSWTKHQKNPLSVKVKDGKFVEAGEKAQKLANKTGQPVSVMSQFVKYSKSGRAKKGYTTTHTVYPEGKNPGPFSEAGKLLGKGRRAVSRPMDQFLGTAGKVGGYLDNELGRVLNPQREYKTEDSFRKALAKATADGTLVHWYGTDHGWVIVTKKVLKGNPEDRSSGPAYLCSNEEGTQLYIVGGDQSLDLSSLGITGPEAEKEIVYIGHVTHITYHARKIFNGKEEEYDYVHRMGEDGGEEPLINYDRINKKIQLAGGTYKINKPLFDTSPGIEN